MKYQPFTMIIKKKPTMSKIAITIFTIIAQYACAQEKISIMFINNRPIVIKDINKEILKDKLVPYLKKFEKNLTIQYAGKYNNYYIETSFIDYRKPTILAYLISKKLITYENWMKNKYEFRERIYSVYYDVNNNKFSNFNLTYYLPTF